MRFNFGVKVGIGWLALFSAGASLPLSIADERGFPEQFSASFSDEAESPILRGAAGFLRGLISEPSGVDAVDEIHITPKLFKIILNTAQVAGAKIPTAIYDLNADLSEMVLRLDDAGSSSLTSIHLKEDFHYLVKEKNQAKLFDVVELILPSDLEYEAQWTDTSFRTEVRGNVKKNSVQFHLKASVGRVFLKKLEMSLADPHKIQGVATLGILNDLITITKSFTIQMKTPKP